MILGKRNKAYNDYEERQFCLFCSFECKHHSLMFDVPLNSVQCQVIKIEKLEIIIIIFCQIY